MQLECQRGPKQQPALSRFGFRQEAALATLQLVSTAACLRLQRSLALANAGTEILAQPGSQTPLVQPAMLLAHQSQTQARCRHQWQTRL